LTAHRCQARLEAATSRPGLRHFMRSPFKTKTALALSRAVALSAPPCEEKRTRSPYRQIKNRCLP